MEDAGAKSDATSVGLASKKSMVNSFLSFRRASASALFVGAATSWSRQ